MKRNTFLLGSILAVTAIGLGGCKKETTESLMKKAAENTTKAESYHMNLSMNVGMKMESSGIRMDMILGGELGADYMAAPQTYYVDGGFQIELLGQKQEMELECYMVPEEGKMAAYGNMKFLDQESGWTKTTVSAEETDTKDLTTFMEDFQKENMELFVSTMTLDEKTVNLHEMECYHITGKVTGEQIETMLTNLMQSEAVVSLEDQEAIQTTLEEFDLKGLAIPVEYWISKKEKLPVKIHMDLKSALDGMMKSVSELTGQDINVTFKTCSLDITYHSYNQIKEITVPEEVKEKAGEETIEDLSEDMGEILELENRKI